MSWVKIFATTAVSLWDGIVCIHTIGELNKWEQNSWGFSLCPGTNIRLWPSLAEVPSKPVGNKEENM